MGRPTPVRSVAGYAVSRINRGAEPHTKGIGRMSKMRFVGLDVHADTIAVAVAEPDGEVRALGIDSLRSAWTGPGGDAQQPFPHRRKWQAWSGQPAPSCRLPLVGTQHGNWNRPGL